MYEAHSVVPFQAHCVLPFHACLNHQAEELLAWLQADFIVPSSREAVDCDSAWNELLREQVPNLFLQALQSFKQLSAPVDDQPMAWVNRWLRSIPLPREMLLHVLLFCSACTCSA